MTRPASSSPARSRLPLALALALALTAFAPRTGLARQFPVMAAARQVTVFGVLADPNGEKDDEKLKDVLPQLRSLLPNHRFKLLKVESKRLVTNGMIDCDLGSGFVATSQLMSPLDLNGKVRIRFDLSVDSISQYQTIVTTPPNQVFYCNRMLPDGTRLIIGIGAR